jgi:hypothetical protein
VHLSERYAEEPGCKANHIRARRIMQPGKYQEVPMVGIVVILVILWFLGVLTKNTLGGLLHILLVIAVIFLLINVIRGRGL